MDSKMNSLMTHKHGPQSRSYFVNDYMFMTDYMRKFEFIAFRKFINTYFYRKKAPMKVLSLKELTECKMLVIFLLKRIDIIVHLQLGTEEMRASSKI